MSYSILEITVTITPETQERTANSYVQKPDRNERGIMVTRAGYKTVTGSKDVVIMTERECLSSAEANIPAGSTVNVTSARYYSWSNPCNLRFECTPQKTNIAGCEMHETSMAVYSNGTSGSTQIIIKAYNSDNSVINDFTRYFMAKVD